VCASVLVTHINAGATSAATSLTTFQDDHDSYTAVDLTGREDRGRTSNEDISSAAPEAPMPGFLRGTNSALAVWREMVTGLDLSSSSKV